MRLFQNLKRTIELLKPWEGYYAVCGGIAACLYRESPRFTADIDIALIDSPDKSAKTIAEYVVKELGFIPKFGFVTDQFGSLISKTALVIGREESNSLFVGIDMLLPVLDWIEDAVKRAQLNKLDFGFAHVASIIPEDLIVAKLFALQGTPDRKHDLDDILSILRNIKELNNQLLDEQLRKYKINVPLEVQEVRILR